MQTTTLTFPLLESLDWMHPNGEDDEMYNFQVSDMTCAHCAATVEKAVKSVDGAARIDIDLRALAVKIESDKPAERFAKAIEDAGYTGELRG